MRTRVEPYGHTLDGEAVSAITIGDGITATILTYGGVIASLLVPDRAGHEANVVLGLDTLEGYETRSPSFGATIGRYANRIGGARFTLDGTEHRLPANEGDNTLHGGTRGFSKRNWTIEACTTSAVTLGYTSPAGEQGFPGTLRTTVRFEIEGRTLRLHYTAETDAPTVVNLTNHSYFNLGGEGSGDIWDHRLTVDAERFLELRTDGIPTGAILDVSDTPFDFRAERAVGERVRDGHPQIMAGQGYDCCYVLRGAGLRAVASVRDARSGRRMTVRTDQPGLQLYSGNRLTGTLKGPSGRAYRSGDGLCFETQHFPDSPNHPAFPSTTLRPGAGFETTTEYAFDGD